MAWKIEFSRRTLKDAQELRSANLENNVKQLRINPPPSLGVDVYCR